jgi:hypothetical protein
VPCNDEIASFYYSELFDIWFPKDNLPAGFNYDKSKESFLNGGYYQYDFQEIELSLIAINSMYFNSNNLC